MATTAKNQMTIELYQFCGFYNSIFDMDSALSDEIEHYHKDENKQVTDEDFNIRFDEYKKAVATEYTRNFMKAVNGIFPKFFTECDESSIEVDSPREYNFRTDRIYAKFTFSDDWRLLLSNFMDDNSMALKVRIKIDWSSRSGFMSFMPNDYNEWYDNIKRSDEPDSNMVSVLLYYALIYAGTFNDITFDTEYKIYANEYIEFKPKARFLEDGLRVPDGYMADRNNELFNENDRVVYNGKVCFIYAMDELRNEIKIATDDDMPIVKSNEVELFDYSKHSDLI